MWISIPNSSTAFSSQGGQSFLSRFEILRNNFPIFLPLEKYILLYFISKQGVSNL